MEAGAGTADGECRKDRLCKGVARGLKGGRKDGLCKGRGADAKEGVEEKGGG